MADCRCAACGCCKHDHRGWRHEWKPNQQGDDMEDQKEPTFREQLASLLNRHSKENESDTPDLILASYLLGALDAFNKATLERERWYGRN